jgi:GxxExxY protein
LIGTRRAQEPPPRANPRRVTAERTGKPEFLAAKERREHKESIQTVPPLRAFQQARIIRIEREMKTINELCDTIRETSYAIHVYHAHGHLEKVYENALVHRLRKAGLEVRQQSSIQVADEDGTIVGEFTADLVVDGRLVVELKAARSLADEHVAQLLGYLKSTRIQHGLLINFGSYKFQIKKFALSQQPPAEHQTH